MSGEGVKRDIQEQLEALEKKIGLMLLILECSTEDEKAYARAETKMHLAVEHLKALVK